MNSCKNPENTICIFCIKSRTNLKLVVHAELFRLYLADSRVVDNFPKALELASEEGPTFCKQQVLTDGVLHALMCRNLDAKAQEEVEPNMGLPQEDILEQESEHALHTFLPQPAGHNLVRLDEDFKHLTFIS